MPEVNEPPTSPPEALVPNPDRPPEQIAVLASRLSKEDDLPASLGVLPLRDLVLFPGMVTPLVIVRPASIQVIKRAAAIGSPVLFLTQRNAEIPEPDREDLHDVGTFGRMLRALRFSDGSMRILVQGIRRVRVGTTSSQSPFIKAMISDLPEINPTSAEAEILRRHLRDDFRDWLQVGARAPVELDAVVSNLQAPGRLADYIAGNLPLKSGELQSILAESDIERRLKLVRQHLTREREISGLNARIVGEVQVAMDKNQREYYLREQLRVVKEELGEFDPSLSDTLLLRGKIEEGQMPDIVRAEALRSLDRMERMHKDSGEHTVARSHVDWLLDMPWGLYSEDKKSLDGVQEILDTDHTGLGEVKERILEFLSVRLLNPQSKGPILCFAGPPGVGKTSMGRSIAHALGRNYQRIALGGIKDESEVRGHRRTYIGSMPGRVIQAMKRAGTMNPVIVLDEIDKVGNDFRGDPASALLEALDPEQNDSFVDHYLDVPFDLSQVLFVCTANVTQTIPDALLDRMELIEIPGYIEEEKVEIARRHLVPKILTDHGLSPDQGSLSDESVQQIIRNYTSEAGVRGLEREIAKIARKVARRVVAKRSIGAIAPSVLADYLGPQKFFQDMAERTDLPGIAVGLAWTASGGDILFIEATQMPAGNRKFKITGQLGDVMKESAETALSWVRSNGVQFGISPETFRDTDLHIHVPQGGIPKDGPSAGVVIAVALVSLLSGRLVNHRMAMTGEVTLRGKILPVGGIKEKVLAARRAGIDHVLLPRQNEKDLLDIPEPLRHSVKTTFIDSLEDVWPHVFESEEETL